MSMKLVTGVLYGSALFINAFLFIPQTIKLYKKKHANEMSLVTFAGFNVIQFLGFLDGIYHNDYALVYGQAISFLACGSITLQIIIYRLRNKSEKLDHVDDSS